MMLGFAGLALVALVLAAVLAPSARTPAGCVDATYASTTGGGSTQACGRAARELCASVAGRTDRYSRAVEQACERAHID